MTNASFVEPVSGALYPLDVPRWRSEDGKPLLVTAQRGLSRDEIERGVRSLWRYRASLPVTIVDPITMGEGCTPLVQRAWGDHRPFFKQEWFSPTGSFKDRGSAVMLSFLRQFGVKAVLEDSSGNGGSSIAGFGAAGGMRVKILAPAYTSPAKIVQARAYGAEVQLVEGPREASEAEAIRQSAQTFYASHNWHPFFLEGTKSLAYELWEDLGFRAPDNVFTPVGAGSSLLGCYLGFRELLAAGQIAKMPRLFAVQPQNCSPIDASFTAGIETAAPREVSQDHRRRRRDPPATPAARGSSRRYANSSGRTVAVTEAEILRALKRLAHAGMFVEPTSAVAMAGFEKLAGAGTIGPKETTVVILTGTGLKSPASFEDAEGEEAAL